MSIFFCTTIEKITINPNTSFFIPQYLFFDKLDGTQDLRATFEGENSSNFPSTEENCQPNVCLCHSTMKMESTTKNCYSRKQIIKALVTHSKNIDLGAIQLIRDTHEGWWGG